MRALLVLLLAGLPAPVAASDDDWLLPPKDEATVETPDDDPRAALCEAYGPGYRHIPGTSTCLKIGGYLSFDVYVGGPSDAGGGKKDAWGKQR